MLSVAPSSTSWDHRPAVSSPLSSSPIRPSSPKSPICSPRSRRHTQSSPIQPPRPRYSTRPARPNPLLQRRQDAHESRRRNFLQTVRQRSQDKTWHRREIEGQFLRSSWLTNLGLLMHDAPAFSEADIHHALAFEQEAALPTPDEDEIMEDLVPDDKPVEGLLDSHEEQPTSPSLPDEYDDIFAELLSKEQLQQSQLHYPPDRMDLTDEPGQSPS
ncbi:hypothetical protein CDD82_4638 [Ophiocordyceps australis]|uniref:Uncharacterized protein n=1 Tax=Ophiocordyceps australis TaxID=1399860 RepID=A0A2C5Z726_9HYPO|nr:hypothetical protein CDD82_4638 [Ophiocordyceps australis]